MYRNTLIAILILIALFCVAVPAKSIVLGGARVVSLPAGPALTGAVSQSLAVSSSGPLPVAGKDYNLTATYFDNNAWAVGLIQPLNNTLNSGVVVLQKKNSVFQVVLPPSNAVSVDQLYVLPNDVASFLRAHESVYNLVPGQQ